MSRRALVTGATGFIGTHLCRELLDRGWRVSGTRRRESDVGRLGALDVDWRVADVRDRAAVASAVAGHDYVFHLAGLTLQRAPAETVREVNVEGTRNVLRACRDHDVERVVFTSTASTRRADGVADESDRAPPVGAYQESKARAEQLVQNAVDEGLDAVTVHPGMVFGPGDRTFTARLLRLVLDPKMVAYLPGGASFVDVGDVAVGLVDAMNYGETGENYILGGENLTYGEALEVIAEEADGRKPVVRLPATLVRAAGPVVGTVNAGLGTRFFPFNADMADLATDTHFYSSEKAVRELGYEYDPLAEHVGAALRWYREEHGGAGAGTATA
jgi:dihydroflavonol-4-reductase